MALHPTSRDLLRAATTSRREGPRGVRLRHAGYTDASATSISLLPLVVLYIARTRAKDALVVTGFEPASDFLVNLATPILGMANT